MMLVNKKIWSFSALLLAVNLFAAEKSSLADEVLKSVISGKSREMSSNFRTVSVPFAKMPAVCQKDCAEAIETYGKEENSATVAYIDIDGNGSSEMLVTYRHYEGNGGTSYDVLTRRNGKWVKCGSLFPVFLSHMKFNGRSGLLVDSKCGGSNRTFTFYELKKGKLVPTVKIEMERSSGKGDSQLKIRVQDREKSQFDYLF